MPLTADSILQEATGWISDTTSPVTVTLPGGTTADTTVVVFFYAFVSPPPPTGWVSDKSTGRFLVYHHRATAAETSWNFTFASGQNTVTWYAVEVEGLDEDVPLDVFVETAATAFSPPGSQLLSTGATALSAATDTFVVSVWGATTSGSVAPTGTWGGYSNDLAEVGVTGGAGTTSSRTLAATRRLSGGADAGPYSDSATYTDAGTTATTLDAGIFTFRAADSPIGYPVSWICGFEHGSHFGIGSTTTIGAALFSAVTGTPGTDLTVSGTSAHSPSAYGLRIVQAGAAKSVQAAAAQYAQGVAQSTLVTGYWLRVVSSSGLVVLGEIVSSNTTLLPYVQIVYDTATSKIGVRLVVSGAAQTPVYQGGTTGTGTWVWVDLRAWASVTSSTGNAQLVVDWALDGVSQTAPGRVTTVARGTWGYVRWGSALAQTITQDVDDLVVSTMGPAFPLGPHSIRALTVDPAGTVTVNGTVGSFSLVTSNATGAALTTGTLATARNNIDELPPTISASSDGVAQTTTAASDYLQFPMADPALAASDVPAAVKVLAPLISTTGAGAGTLSITGWDGTTETAVITPTAAMTPGSSTTPSATVPPYASGMWPNSWTPAKLAAAALRMGYSTDATPDMGVHALYLEYATRTAVTARQVSIEDDVFTVDLILSPYSSASMAYEVASNDPTRGATLDYSLAGVPQTPVYVAASSTTTVTVDVDEFGDVSDLTLTPDP